MKQLFQAGFFGETEYITMTEAVKETIWLRGLFSELSSSQEVAVFHRDLPSAIHLSKDQMIHEKIKYTDMKYHFIQDIIARGDIIARKIGVKGNPAKILTKFLSITKFKHYLDLIGICGT